MRWARSTIIVGFQTKMKYGAQTDVFKIIPGLENASFARLGGIHRNTFLNSPTLLDAQMRLKSRPNIRFAGQITGVEGYVESAAMGLLAARLAVAERRGHRPAPPPPETAMGALVTHITGGADAKTFQPMNVNFGLFPPIDAKGGRKGRKDRYKAYTDRAKDRVLRMACPPKLMRTRFAPSPTGPLHLGHAYAALVAHARATAGAVPAAHRGHRPDPLPPGI